MVRLSRRLQVNQLSCAGYHILTAFLQQFGLLSSAFDRLYSRNRNCFLLLRLLRCFNSAGCLPFRTASRNWRDVAFNNPRFKGRLRLPWAYPSLLGSSSFSRTELSSWWFICSDPTFYLCWYHWSWWSTDSFYRLVLIRLRVNRCSKTLIVLNPYIAKIFAMSILFAIIYPWVHHSLLGSNLISWSHMAFRPYLMVCSETTWRCQKKHHLVA